MFVLGDLIILLLVEFFQKFSRKLWQHLSACALPILLSPSSVAGLARVHL